MIVNGTVFDDTANYTCEVGFRFPSGVRLVVTSCNDTGNWTMPTENCQGWQPFVHLHFVERVASFLPTSPSIRLNYLIIS